MTATTNLKFEKSSSALENILNQQRSQYDKAGIGYSTKQEHTVEKNEFRSPKKNKDGNLQIVANNLKNINEENSKENCFSNKTNSAKVSWYIYWLLLFLLQFWPQNSKL